jgi:hypothetical protein
MTKWYPFGVKPALGRIRALTRALRDPLPADDVPDEINSAQAMKLFDQGVAMDPTWRNSRMKPPSGNKRIPAAGRTHHRRAEQILKSNTVGRSLCRVCEDKSMKKLLTFYKGARASPRQRGGRACDFFMARKKTRLSAFDSIIILLRTVDYIFRKMDEEALALQSRQAGHL